MPRSTLVWFSPAIRSYIYFPLDFILLFSIKACKAHTIYSRQIQLNLINNNKINNNKKDIRFDIRYMLD